MAAKAEKTGSSVSCFNSSKSYDPKAVEDANTEGKGKKSFFQKLLGTKTKKIVGIAIASIVVATLAAVTVALAASLGANSPGENIDPPVNETLGSGEIPTVNGTGLPTVNSTETPVISAETPVIPTGAQPETPTINPNYPSPDSLCGYKLPESAMAPECAERPFSLYENLNTEGMSQSDLRIEYIQCAAAHTSTPCNNNATAFSTFSDRLPDNVIHAFAEQGRNSTLPVYYDAGYDICVSNLKRFVTTTDIALQYVLRCSARRSDIDSLPSNCACVPDNTINPSDVPSVAAPTLPDDMYESPSDSICGSRFSDNSSPQRQCTSLASYNSMNMENLSEAEIKVIYEDCVFDHTDAACKRLPVFANVTITSDRVYRFTELDQDQDAIVESARYATGYVQCISVNQVRFHNSGHISDEKFAERKAECLIDRAVAAATLSNCKCLPTEFGTISV